jgi:hypothetical protein|nr:MAG TPA: hypothetical protein [Caudoviricetes sp.]
MNKYYVYTVNSDEPFVVRTKDDLQEEWCIAVVKTKGQGLWRFEYEGEEKPGRTPTKYDSVFSLDHIVSIVKIIE